MVIILLAERRIMTQFLLRKRRESAER